MIFFNKKSNKLAFKVPLGMQRRTMMTCLKQAGQVLVVGADMADAVKEVVIPAAIEVVKSVKITETTGNSGNSGDNTSAKTTSTTTKTVGTSPDIPDWDPFSVLNLEWFAHSPFTLETTYDLMVVALILFISTLIIVVYVMWSSYFSNVVTSFLIGEKKLPAYHLALISIAVLMSVFTLALVYLAAFTGMLVEAASLKGLTSDITKLEGEIAELRTLLEVYSKKS
jgi:hypothetical protein